MIRNRHRYGDHLTVDQESGEVIYASQGAMNWDGTWRRAENCERRQPQEFVRAGKDPRALRHIRPDPGCETPVTEPCIGDMCITGCPTGGPGSRLFSTHFRVR